jgi:hypothetical protein
MSLGSWVGLLISAASEYGFDVDSPLTPSVWVVIAFCADGSYSNNFAAIFTVTNTTGTTNSPARYYRVRLVP